MHWLCVHTAHLDPHDRSSPQDQTNKFVIIFERRTLPVCEHQLEECVSMWPRHEHSSRLEVSRFRCRAAHFRSADFFLCERRSGSLWCRVQHKIVQMWYTTAVPRKRCFLPPVVVHTHIHSFPCVILSLCLRSVFVVPVCP